jgi:alkyl hydroperoxide reductase subunit AhpC
MEYLPVSNTTIPGSISIGKRIRLSKPAFPMTADRVAQLSQRAGNGSAFRALRFSVVIDVRSSIRATLIRLL